MKIPEPGGPPDHHRRHCMRKGVVLRAERNGELVGRIYEVKYAATDSSDKTATKTVTVVVPHDDRNQGGQLP